MKLFNTFLKDFYNLKIKIYFIEFYILLDQHFVANHIHYSLCSKSIYLDK